MAADLATHAGVRLTGPAVRRRAPRQLRRSSPSPERSLVFDINDFDETLPGPWEWDVKRLAASFAVAGRDTGFAAPAAPRRGPAAVRAYREAMRRLRRRCGNLDVWYARLDVDAIARRVSSAERRLEAPTGRRARSAKARDQGPACRRSRKLTAAVDGQSRGSSSNPPLLVPIERAAAEAEAADIEANMRRCCGATASSLPPDRRHLLEQLPARDIARKVVGVGSVGTRVLDRADARPRRRRPAVPAGQGGAAVGPRAVRRRASEYATRASASSTASGSCRPRATSSSAGCAPPGSTGWSATSTSASCGTGRRRADSTR